VEEAYSNDDIRDGASFDHLRLPPLHPPRILTKLRFTMCSYLACDQPLRIKLYSTIPVSLLSRRVHVVPPNSLSFDLLSSGAASYGLH
jgi:hypothetical protein